MRGVCAELWIQWSLKQTAGPAVSLCLRGAAGEWLYSPPRAQTAGGREFLGILQFPEDSTSTTYLSGTFLEFNSSHKNTIMTTPVSMFHYLKAWIKLAARTQTAERVFVLLRMFCMLSWAVWTGSQYIRGPCMDQTDAQARSDPCQRISASKKEKKSWTE